MLCDIQPVWTSCDSRLHFSLPRASRRAGGIAISEAASAMRLKQNSKVVSKPRKHAKTRSATVVNTVVVGASMCDHGRKFDILLQKDDTCMVQKTQKVKKSGHLWADLEVCLLYLTQCFAR